MFIYTKIAHFTFVVFKFSLRVNLDVGKAAYARFIQTDKEIPGTIVRSTTIPEELGRIQYLLSDKTGTLTQNEMVCRFSFKIPPIESEKFCKIFLKVDHLINCLFYLTLFHTI